MINRSTRYDGSPGEAALRDSIFTFAVSAFVGSAPVAYVYYYGYYEKYEPAAGDLVMVVEHGGHVGQGGVGHEQKADKWPEC